MTISRSRKLDSRWIISGLGVALPALFLYWLTSYPSVAYIDSGELAVDNWTLGIAHPTGYPVYTLLGRLFSLLPFELIKTQILLGMLCTIAALAIICRITYWLSGDSVRADDFGGTPRALPGSYLALIISLGLLLAVSPLFWSQGVTNEVYSLHLVLLSLLLLIILQPYSDRNLILGGYLLGLSFGNHLSTILIVPTMLAYLVINRRAAFRSRRPIWLAILGGLTAASVYLYLPIRSALDPIFNWGHPTTWENFVRHVSGWQYQVWMFHRSAAELGNQLVKFAGILYAQFPFPFWLPIAAGFYFGFRSRRTSSLYLILLLVSDLIYALNFSIPDIDNYLLPSVVVLFLFGVIGAIELFRAKSMLQYAVPALVFIFVFWGLAVNWGTNDEARDTAALDGVHNYYKSVDQDALILCADWDFISPWLYSHFYLKERPDVVIVDPELVRRSWYFDWIRHADSDLYSYIKPEIDAFLPNVRKFERGEPYDVQAIESTYRAILHKLTVYPKRPVYYSITVQLGFPPPGKVEISGQLFRIVRAGETFAPPAQPLSPPRCGKSAGNLDWRDRLHLSDFYRLQPPDTAGTR